MMVPQIDALSLLARLVALILLSLVWTTIRRLYFSPLSKFPGPKLAAASWWYEFYYDVILGGRYWSKIKELHDKYGPVVRINPYEIHISDPEFYDTVYASSATGLKRDRWDWSHRYLGIPDTSLLTVDHDHHRMRRSAFGPFFSTASVRNLQPIVNRTVERMMERFQDFQNTGEVMVVNWAMAAFANDVVSKYCFGYSNDLLGEQDFHPDIIVNLEEGLKMGPILKHNYWVMQLLEALPEWLSAWLAPAYGGFVKEKKVFGVQAKKVMESSRVSFTETEHRTIFHEILDSKLPPEEKDLDRLSKEGILQVAAGTMTTAWVIAVGVYYLLANPLVLRKLRTELQAAIPNPSEPTTLAVLESLPYLRGVVYESLRLSYGVTNRLPRIAHEDMRYTDKSSGRTFVIPAGTPCSSTSLVIHRDETKFPSSKEFRPERWVENPRLERYMVSFSKGTRQCIGMNLASAEIYLMISRIFRNYGTRECELPGDQGVLELVGTDEKDVEPVGDFQVPMPGKGSKGIRICILTVDK